MNNFILFAGGVILGILLSLTIVQNDFHSGGATPAKSNVDSSQLIDSLRKSIDKSTIPAAPAAVSGHVKSPVRAEELANIKPLVASSANSVSTPLLTKDHAKIQDLHKQKENIRWAPGKEMSLDKFKEEALAAQAKILAPPAAPTQSQSQSIDLPSLVNSAEEKRRIRQERKQKQLEKMQQQINNEPIAPLPITTTTAAAKPIASSSSPLVPSSPTGERIHYHSQCLRNFSQYSPYVPSYEGVKQRGLPLPDMSLQRAPYEKDNLKLHLCNGVFEAYSASYLTTVEHMLAVPADRFNLTWVNCEMASFIYMRQSNNFYNKDGARLQGAIMQTLDVLDFSAIHLSAYERSTKKHWGAIMAALGGGRGRGGGGGERSIYSHRGGWKHIDNIVYTGKVLRQLNDPTVRQRDVHYSEEAKRTVVLMPFLGGAMGAGHSELNNRFEYLKTCFWSLYEFFPHIVVAVAREEDVTWARTQSTLPFYDVFLLTPLPKSASLPVASTQELRRRLGGAGAQGSTEGGVTRGGVWGNKFDFVFYTESDQILIAREMQMLYNHLKKNPGHMLLPHRLMPYGAEVLQYGHKRPDIVRMSSVVYNITRQDKDKEQYLGALPDGVKNLAKTSKDDLSSPPPISPMLLPPHQNNWMKQSCCLPRQNCLERKDWRSVADPQVPVIQYYGMYVPLGNINFLREEYRYCTLGDYKEYCP